MREEGQRGNEMYIEACERGAKLERSKERRQGKNSGRWVESKALGEERKSAKGIVPSRTMC